MLFACIQAGRPEVPSDIKDLMPKVITDLVGSFKRDIMLQGAKYLLCADEHSKYYRQPSFLP